MTEQLVPEALSPERFKDFVRFVTPKADELRWAEINWETDLWTARRKAAEVQKPVFMWGMNGNPLGCV